METENIAVGTIRPNGLVESNVRRLIYPIRKAIVFGREFLPGTEEFDKFVALTPRSVYIVGTHGDGVVVEIGRGMRMGEK